MGVKVKEWKGAWWIFINHEKRRKSKRVGVGEAGKKAAKQAASQIQARLALGQFVFDELKQPKPDLATVGSYLQAWLREHAAVNCKPSTYIMYQWAVEQILVPDFGPIPLNDMSAEHIRCLIAKYIGRGKSKATIRNYLSPLRTAYSQAIDDGLVTRNPAGRLGKLLKNAKNPAKEMRPLTRQETNTLLASAKTGAPLIYPLLLCAVRTGLRRGELIGLQWGDVDLEGRYLLVRRAVVRGKVGLPKSNKIRRVDVSGQLCVELKAQKEVRELEAMAKDQTLKFDEPVFLSPMGLRWDERNVEKPWHRALKLSGIRRVRLHDLRHTFASQLIEQGAHPKYIQEQLGHASITMTMDTYGHMFPNRNRGLVDGLDTMESDEQNASPAQPSQTAGFPAFRLPSLTPHYFDKILVRPAGIEPATLSLEVRSLGATTPCAA